MGFAAASHWDYGREIVQKVSPVYSKNIRDGVKKIEKGFKETQEKLKDTISK